MPVPEQSECDEVARISERVPFAAKGWMLLSKRSFCVPRNVELYEVVLALAAIAKPRAERGLLIVSGRPSCAVSDAWAVRAMIGY